MDRKDRKYGKIGNKNMLGRLQLLQQLKSFDPLEEHLVSKKSLRTQSLQGILIVLVVSLAKNTSTKGITTYDLDLLSQLPHLLQAPPHNIEKDHWGFVSEMIHKLLL